MKRMVLGLWGLGICLMGCRALAQPTADTAAALAEREYAEERYRKLSSEIEDLRAAYQALQKRISSLTDELQRMHEEAANNSKFLTREELTAFKTALEKKFREINEKHKADTQLIVEQINELGKTRAVAPPPDHPAGAPANPAAAPEKPSKGYWYEVKSGDYLSTIVEAYRKSGTKVTQDMVLKANPNLKPERMRPGQKIFIPDPALP